MTFAPGILLCLTCVFCIVAGMFLGFYLCMTDVTQRLKGEKRVDEFWRKRGMR